MRIRLGAGFSSQNTTWPALRDAAVVAERAGIDSLLDLGPPPLR
jgi:hypothetical protein